MIHIAIMGFGIVGSGVAEVLTQNSQIIQQKLKEEINLKYILDIKDFTGHPLEHKIVRDLTIILNDPEITIVAELMGGAHPAFEFTTAALKAGKSVVTSNKEVVATFGAELLEIAKENQVRYLFEASVGGGIPIIRPINECLAANDIYEIDGILNGTTNYILTQMIKEKKSFATSLKEAQAKGYAESNPVADVEGIDACRKICILAALAFGKLIAPKQVHTEGIAQITLEDVQNAEKYGTAIKLIGRAIRYREGIHAGKIFILVSPCLVPYSSPLSSVEDVYNGILVKGNAIGDVMFYGRGAGKLPTASAVVADMIDIAKCSPCQPEQMGWEKAEASILCDHRAIEAQFYLRLEAKPEQILDCFESIHSIAENAFVTECMTETELQQKLERFQQNGGKVLAQMRVLEK